MQSPQQTIADLEEATNVIRERLGTQSFPSIAIVLGTGLGTIGDTLQSPVRIPYSAIPHFPLAVAPSHTGQLIVGMMAGKQVVVMQGRIHLYDGASVEQIAFPIRLLRVLGVDTLFITNAAGGLDPYFQPGEIMAIRDHINATGQNPLLGPNVDELGLRFPDMTRVYDRELLELASQAALEANIILHQGVYVGVLGPSMETPAETRMLRLIGADAVGMSTIPEVIAATHCGMRILAFSAITNVNRPDCMEPAPLETIIANAGSAGVKIIRMFEGILRLLP